MLQKSKYLLSRFDKLHLFVFRAAIIMAFFSAKFGAFFSYSDWRPVLICSAAAAAAAAAVYNGGVNNVLPTHSDEWRGGKMLERRKINLAAAGYWVGRVRIYMLLLCIVQSAWLH